MSTARIVVVEDEPDLRACIDYNLAVHGYRVSLARDGREGLERARRELPDLVLLDRMLPDVDGIEVCRHLKSDPRTRPIRVVFLTALDQERDVVLGLGLGADDYVRKPFRPLELVARVQAVLRRPGVAPVGIDPERLLVGPLVVDRGRHLAEVDGRPLALTASEFRLLSQLASRPGRVYGRAQLVDLTLGGGDLVERNVDVHVASLRRKLGRRRDLIETVRGIGYRLAGGAP